MAGIERLKDRDPVEINKAPRGTPSDWQFAGTFSHYDGRGWACYYEQGSDDIKRVEDLTRIRKRT